MVGRRVNAAPGEAHAPERLKPGGHHLLSRQRCGTVSTFERRRKETRERKALQGIGRPKSAAFSECLDFRATTQGQARLSRNDAVEAAERGRLDRSRRRPADEPVAFVLAHQTVSDIYHSNYSARRRTERPGRSRSPFSD